MAAAAFRLSRQCIGVIASSGKADSLHQGPDRRPDGLIWEDSSSNNRTAQNLFDCKTPGRILWLISVAIYWGVAKYPLRARTW
jgi:hypothetical protein